MYRREIEKWRSLVTKRQDWVIVSKNAYKTGASKLCILASKDSFHVGVYFTWKRVWVVSLQSTLHQFETMSQPCLSRYETHLKRIDGGMWNVDLLKCRQTHTKKMKFPSWARYVTSSAPRSKCASTRTLVRIPRLLPVTYDWSGLVIQRRAGKRVSVKAWKKRQSAKTES